LPLPGPAMTSSGPSPCSTAWSCSGLRFNMRATKSTVDGRKWNNRKSGWQVAPIPTQEICAFVRAPPLQHAAERSHSSIRSHAVPMFSRAWASSGRLTFKSGLGNLEIPVQPVNRPPTRSTSFPKLSAAQGPVPYGIGQGGEPPRGSGLFILPSAGANTKRLSGGPHTSFGAKILLANGVGNQADVLAVH
jgi:hypothetical protein